MLTITIPDQEGYDSEADEFTYFPGATLTLEHSLISLKKWEQKWHIPFLSKDVEKTYEQTLDYIRCMTINPNVDPNVYKHIPGEVAKQISDYINEPMTATWFNDNRTIGAQSKRGEVVTAEIIYYWMITLGIPIEFQKWHLNSLLTLIRVVNIKNQPEKKMGKKDWANQRSALNAARRAKNHSTG